MKKTVILFITTLLITSAAVSQNPVMKFAENRYNFGQIQEANGKAIHEFIFTNEGTDALLISNIRSSCDWITTLVSDSIVEPGDNGTITVMYDATGHLGKFAKTISITANTQEPVTRLFVLGEVMPKSLLKVGSYPYRIGPLSTKLEKADFGTIYKGDSASISIEYANSTSQTVELAVTDPAKQSFVTVNVSRTQIAPNEEGIITINFYSDKCRIWGPYNTKLHVLFNGVDEKENAINLSAVIEEDFSKLTPEELEAAPILELEDTLFDMGKVKAGGELSKKLAIKNNGKNPLELRRIQVLGGKMLKVVPETKGVLQGGKKNALVFSITTPRKIKSSKTYTRTINLITNDPNHVYNNIIVKWTVEP